MLTVNQNTHLHLTRELDSRPHFMHAAEATCLSSVFPEILWVQHPVNGIYWPWLTAAVNQFLTRLHHSFPSLTKEEIQSGLDMGLLVSQQVLSDLCLEWERSLLAARRHLAAHGWARLPKITFSTYCMTVDYYMRNTTLGPDDQVVGRQSQHNPPLLCSVHRQFTTILQRLLTERIKPSYCFLGRYPQGSELVRHTDRPQCEWNVSLLLSKDDVAHQWPLFVQEPNGTVVPIYAGVGEPIVYRGTDVPHWREKLTSGSATGIFFHYVQQEFAGTLR